VSRYSVVFLFLSISQLCNSQAFTTINYTVSDGLPSKEAYEVFQDKRGFIWFATDNGVVKYDGFEMQRFTEGDGLPDLVVFGFYEDYKGRIWFRTYSGKLGYYENDQIFSYKYNHTIAKAISRSIISSLYIDSLDQLWFSTYTKASNNYCLHGRISDKGEMEIEYEERGSIYYKDLGTGFLLSSCHISIKKPALINDRLFRLNLTDECRYVNPIAIQWKNKLYIARCQDIFEFDGNNFVKKFTAHASIISLSRDRQDHLWIGYAHNGVEKFITSDFTNGSTLSFLKDFSVSKVLEDHERGLWFSTLQKGVFPNIGIKNTELPTGNEIKLVASSSNNVCIALSNGEVLKLGKEGKMLSSIIRTPPVIGLFIDNNKNILVTTEKEKLVCFDSSFHLKWKNECLMQYAFEDENGKIWLTGGGDTPQSVQSLSGVGKIYPVQPYFLSRILVLKSKLLITNRYGLSITDSSFAKFEFISSLEKYKILNLIKLNDSLIFLATRSKGFVIFNSNTRTHIEYNTDNKFIANDIFDVIKSDEHLWLNTENGLIRLNINSLIENKLLYNVLSFRSGLISPQINYLASAGNYIWAFSETGFSLINKQHSKFSNRQPQFYLKRIKLNNKSLNGTGKIRMAYDKSNLQISFGFISFNNQKIFMRYKLKSDEKWNRTLSRVIQLYSLSPGQYILELEYSVDNINWLHAYTSSSIEVLPPLWKTWYFQTIVALILLLIIYIYFRTQIKIYKRHQTKLIQSEISAIEKERSRIAKDLHDSVGTDFTAIKMRVSQILKVMDYPEKNEVEQQFQHTIQEIKGIIYDLSPPGLERYGLMAGFRNYVDRINGSIPIKINLNTFGNEVKNMNVSIAVFRVVQELISNSLKHSNAQHINLHINAFDDLLNIVYEDDGKGFSYDSNHKGLGLYSIESRVQSIKGQLKFESGSFGISYSIDIPLSMSIGNDTSK
jgi:signal transduction histidine kinase